MCNSSSSVTVSLERQLVFNQYGEFSAKSLENNLPATLNVLFMGFSSIDQILCLKITQY